MKTLKGANRPSIGILRRRLKHGLYLTCLAIPALILLFHLEFRLVTRGRHSEVDEVQYIATSKPLPNLPDEFREIFARELFPESPPRYQNHQVQKKPAAGFLFLSLNKLQSLNKAKLRPEDWKSIRYCQVNCATKVPCVYFDEVDLRIIVLGATRGKSLGKTLQSLHRLDTLGDRVAVDIWLDRLTNGTIDKESYDTALNFSVHWKTGRACVHTQTAHAFIANQWVYSYRPRADTSEIALFIEDDVDLSPFAYKWLKAAHAHYRGTPDVAGFTMKMEQLRVRSEARRKDPLKGPKQHPTFMYPVIACWGYSPIPWVWREFQIFFHEMRKNGTVKPYVDGYLHTVWFKNFEETNTEESMAHEMWHVYYTTKKKLFTVYSNLLEYTGREDVLLNTNRMEDGLHFTGLTSDNSHNLMKVWNESYVKFPSPIDTVRLDIEGFPIS